MSNDLETIWEIEPHTEAKLINFMYEFINRFITRDGQEKVMTRLFGTDEWHSLGLNLLLAAKRKNKIHFPLLWNKS